LTPQYSELRSVRHSALRSPPRAILFPRRPMNRSQGTLVNAPTLPPSLSPVNIAKVSETSDLCPRVRLCSGSLLRCFSAFLSLSPVS
jgi:hypothetical protein